MAATSSCTTAASGASNKTLTMMTGVGPRQGFVYVSVVDSTAMAKAEAGRTVRIPGRGPPWIAVDHELSSVVVARWPGRLWAVEIVDAVTAQDGAGGLRADAGYTRAAAVKILHAVPVAALFGAHGAEVCAVIEAAAKLDLAGAERLAEMRVPVMHRTGYGGAGSSARTSLSMATMIWMAPWPSVRRRQDRPSAKHPG